MFLSTFIVGQKPAEKCTLTILINTIKSFDNSNITFKLHVYTIFSLDIFISLTSSVKQCLLLILFLMSLNELF